MYFVNSSYGIAFDEGSIILYLFGVTIRAKRELMLTFHGLV